MQETELQLRNYNRDNTALFSIITDGRIWRFYLSQTGGKFFEKCFKIVDILDDELDEVENSLNTFLQKSQIEIGEAEREAKKYLKLNEMERLMQALLPQARKLIEKPPFPSLPEALVGLVNEEGYTISAEQAQAFIKKAGKNLAKLKPESKHPAPTVQATGAEQVFSPGQPPDLHFTKIIQATLGSQSVNKWNALIRCAVKLALKNNVSISHLKELGVRVEEGHKTNEGFRPLTNMNVSVPGVDAGHAWHLALLLAKELNIEIKVRFRWREKDGAAYPGEQGLLHWKPQS